MSGSRSIRSFRCADTLWRALEDEADEREKTVDTVITEALWAHLREVPEFSSVSVTVESTEESPRPNMARAPSTDVAADEDDAPTAMLHNPRLATPVRRGPRRGRLADDSEPTVDNLKIVRDADGNLLEPETGKIVEQIRDELEMPRSEKPPADRPDLALYFSGSRYPVKGDRFLIGRSSKGTDLQIRDANVSRKHAAVIFHDGGWFLHDLQSTNGIEYKGRRIRSRRIEASDRYTICDYDLIFELDA